MKVYATDGPTKEEEESGMKRVLCWFGMHPRPLVEIGTWPYPLSFTCPWCGGKFVDHGPEH